MSYEFSRREIIAAKLRHVGFLVSNRYRTVYPKQNNPPLVGAIDENGNFHYRDSGNPALTEYHSRIRNLLEDKF